MRACSFALVEPVLDVETFKALVKARAKVQTLLDEALRSHPANQAILASKQAKETTGGDRGPDNGSAEAGVHGGGMHGDACMADAPSSAPAAAAAVPPTPSDPEKPVELSAEEIKVQRHAALAARKDMLTAKRGDVAKDQAEHQRKIAEAEARLEQLNEDKHELVIKLKQALQQELGMKRQAAASAVGGAQGLPMSPRSGLASPTAAAAGTSGGFLRGPGGGELPGPPSIRGPSTSGQQRHGDGPTTAAALARAGSSGGHYADVEARYGGGSRAGGGDGQAAPGARGDAGGGGGLDVRGGGGIGAGGGGGGAGWPGGRGDRAASGPLSPSGISDRGMKRENSIGDVLGGSRFGIGGSLGSLPYPPAPPTRPRMGGSGSMSMGMGRGGRGSGHGRSGRGEDGEVEEGEVAGSPPFHGRPGPSMIRGSSMMAPGVYGGSGGGGGHRSGGGGGGSAPGGGWLPPHLQPSGGGDRAGDRSGGGQLPPHLKPPPGGAGTGGLRGPPPPPPRGQRGWQGGQGREY
ncbi:hypothetical protein FOA52_006894 [Chlamydomonas sp. UWO 241]|nr:hypothetical protein FOA52_006894 [Chlamydomonas sp. UWO 241]